MPKNKKYLVTGGTGFLGRSLVRKLVKEGGSVRVLDNDSRGAKNKLHDVIDQIETIEGDIRNPEVVRNACKGIDVVCHLAYLNGTEFFYSKPDLVLDIGVKGMVNIIDGCIAEGVKEFFLASSSEVYQAPPAIPTSESVPLIVPDPLNPRYSYGGGKIISELMAINYGKKYFDRVVIFRPHNVIGPDMGNEHVIPQFALRMNELVKENKNGNEIVFPIQGTGKETRSFIFIDDFIEGLMLLIDKGEHLNIYNIGTMEEISIETVVGEVAKYFKVNLTIQPSSATKGSTLRRCPDILKLKNLGFNPLVSFSEAIWRTIEWYSPK